MVGWDMGGSRLQYIKKYTVRDPGVGVTTLETLWHTKTYKGFHISYVIYWIYVYIHTEKIYHIYILEYIIGEMEKQHHQGLKVSLLHSLHVSRYSLGTRSSTTQVCYIKIWRHSFCLHSKFYAITAYCRHLIQYTCITCSIWIYFLETQVSIHLKWTPCLCKRPEILTVHVLRTMSPFLELALTLPNTGPT